MGAREDDDWFNTKYAEASCHEHGDQEMHWDAEEGEWFCGTCWDEDDLNGVYLNG